LAAIELSQRDGVGARRFKELIDRFGSPQAALEAQNRQLTWPWADSSHSARQPVDRRFLVGPAAGATYYGAEDYPSLLGHTREPPPYLYWKGVVWPLIGRLVAIVGPRNCSRGAKEFAWALAAQLAAAGVGVVSGGALGVDSAAHHGALSHGGLTVWVAANGIDRVYPRQNDRLHRRVQRRGCVLTELLPGTPPRRDFFPTRNRIIAGLCGALVVVEGRLHSGTYSSVCHGWRMGKALFAWTGSPRRSLQALPQQVLARGGVPLGRARAEPILEVLGAGVE
jgi:DNA processing protein